MLPPDGQRSPHSAGGMSIRPTRVIAFAASIALHGSVIYFVSRAHWSTIENERGAPPEVVWLSDWQPVAATTTEAALDIVPPEPQASVDEATEDSADSEDAADTTDTADPTDEPPATDAADVADVAEAVDAADAAESASVAELPDTVTGDDADAADTGAESSPTPAEGPGRAYIVREVDWDQERRQAVAMVREQAERDAGYPTFSLADVFDEPPPEEPGLARSVFDTPRSGRALMRPGQARTRVGGWIGEKCNRLLGGISVFGLVSLCAPDNTPSDLFESIKPEYLKKRPAELVVRPEEVDAVTDPAVP
jgi:hypothetical protein